MSCVKIRFPTQAAAETRIRTFKIGSQRQKRDRRGPQRAYRCDKCDGWHITSQPVMKKTGRKGA